MGDLVKSNVIPVGQQIENLPINKLPSVSGPTVSVPTVSVSDAGYTSPIAYASVRRQEDKATKDNIDVVKMNIVMNTNKNSIQKLTANLFVFDDNKSIKGDYPFLCTNVSYNHEYFDTKNTFSEKVQVFFNEAEFEKFVLDQNKNIIKDSDEITRNTKQNIQLMLEILFPISFPVKDDVIQISGISLSMFDLTKMFNKVFRRSDYVYLNMDKPSTVTQVIWLDTISSNPVYVQLYELMKAYKKKLVSYVLDKYARKVEPELPYNKLYSEITGIMKRVNYRYNGNKELRKLDDQRQKSNRKILQNDGQANKELDMARKQTLQNENRELKKTELIRQLSELKRILSDNIEFNEEISQIESQLKINEVDDKNLITKIFQSYRNSALTDDDLRRYFQDYKSHGSTWWKLYFIFSGLKKNTALFNTFVEEYVNKFVLKSRDESRYWGSYYNNQSSNEGKFYKSLSDLDFHFDLLKKVDDFMKQRRKPLIDSKSLPDRDTILEIFKDEEERSVIRFDAYLTLFNDDKKVGSPKEYTGVDVIRQSKSTDEDEKQTSDYKTKFYEIQLGIAVVGGKIPNAPSNFWCAFNSAKLANDYKFLTKYNLGGEIHLYPFIEIEEMPVQPLAKSGTKSGLNVREKPQEFGTILNLKKRGGRRITHKKRSFAKKTRKRSFQRDFQEKKAKDN